MSVHRGRRGNRAADDAMKTIVTACLAAVLAGCGSDEQPSQAPTWGPAFDAVSFGWILSVWGPSSDELYAVGGEPDRGRIRRFDGQAWTDVELEFEVPLLNWAYGFGPNDAFVVGSRGTVLRYDGTWTRTASVTDQDLWGVWGASADDIWAVGGSVFGGQPTILRYDGTAWSKMAFPTLSKARVNAFFKVWGTGPDNVYVVGQRGVVLHYDGVELRELLVGTTRDLISLWGTGPDRIVIAGGRANGEIVTFDGTEWRNIVVAPNPGLNGIWMRRPDVAHLVGVNGTVLRLDFDSGEVTNESPREVTTDFHAVYGAPDGERMVAVGGNFQFVDGPFQGVAYERGLIDED